MLQNQFVAHSVPFYIGISLIYSEPTIEQVDSF